MYSMSQRIYVMTAVLFLWMPMPANADYANGCADASYHQYIEHSFAQLESNNKRQLRITLRDYQNSVQNSDNPYRVLSDLSYHIKYSAQFDPIDTVKANIEDLHDHADALRFDQQVAASALDGFSNENHAVGIARAWIAYRQGNTSVAFEELLASLELTNSAVMASFGPDFNFVRQIYSDGHIVPVLSYLDKTEDFWTGKKADNLRYIWRHMIAAKCKVQFQFVDTQKAIELNLRVKDVSQTL